MVKLKLDQDSFRDVPLGLSKQVDNAEEEVRDLGRQAEVDEKVISHIFKGLIKSCVVLDGKLVFDEVLQR